MTDCPLSGRGQGDVSIFYILDLENVATASLGVLVLSTKLVDGQLVDYTYTTVERVVAECTSLLYVGRL